MKSERGAVIIEATLSLSIFMFAIFTIFSMYHVTLAQARINAALNATAKDISQYSYVYDLTGLNEKQSSIAHKGGAAQSIISSELSGIRTFWDALIGLGNTVGSITSSPDHAESFLYYWGNGAIDGIKGEVVGKMAQGMMKKHFGSEPDKFLRQLGVVNGISGLRLGRSQFFKSGTSSDIVLNVQYQIRVIKLLNIDMKLNFEHSARTRAWRA